MIETFASETAEAITHLANAAASDKDIIRQLTTANEKLTMIVTQQAEQITKLLAQIANNKKPKAHNNDDNKRRFKPNGNYCWTHGWDLPNAHTSASCNRPKEGHKREATKDNTMGGSDNNKSKV
jgi:hypothetical protein